MKLKKSLTYLFLFFTSSVFAQVNTEMLLGTAGGTGTDAATNNWQWSVGEAVTLGNAFGTSGMNQPLSCNPLIVTSTADDGVCGTLRHAITWANDNDEITGVRDEIRFAIQETGGPVYRIALGTSLPDITSPLLIGGRSQNNTTVGVLSDSLSANHGLLIILDGQNNGFSGLNIRANNVTVRGLSIVNCADAAIYAEGVQDIEIEGNYIGVEPGGTAGANGYGVYFKDVTSSGAFTTYIGGATSKDINVISNNARDGVFLEACSGVALLRNFIGLDTLLQNAQPNGEHGVHLLNSNTNNIGVAMANGAFNYIAANGTGASFHQIFLENSADNTITNNRIGFLGDGAVVPSLGDGIHIADNLWNLVGDASVSLSNKIANAQNGIVGRPSIQRNLIFDNTIKGISNGIVPDPITKIEIQGADTVIVGIASSGVQIQVYADAAGQGRVYLGETTSDILSGSWTFPFMPGMFSKMNAVLGAGDKYITYTYTKANVTSEFSAPYLFFICAPLAITVDPINPTCGGPGNDGMLVVHGLTEGATYDFYSNKFNSLGKVATGDSIVLTNLLDGTYTDLYVDSATCLSNTITAVTLAPAPNAPVVGAGTDMSICADQIVLLSGNYLDATGGIWTTSGTGSFDDPNSVGTFYYPSPDDITLGSVTLTLTSVGHDPACVPATDDMIVTITPTPVVDAGVDLVVCSGTPINLTGSVSIATGGSWTSSGTGVFLDPNSLNTTYTPSLADEASGSVNLTLTSTGNGTCAAVSDVVTITINPNPIADFIFPTACVNSPVNFNNLSSISSGSITNYSWDFGDLKTSTLQNPSNLYTNSGSFNVVLTATSDMGCVGTALNTVTVATPPTISVTGNDTTCLPNDAFIVVKGLTDGVSYDFYSDVTNVSNNIAQVDSIVIAGLTLGTYTNIYVQESGSSCNSNTENITIADYTSTFAKNAVPVQDICEGDSISYNFSGPSTSIVGGTDPKTYTWTGDGLVNVTTSLPKNKALPLTSGTIKMILEDARFCKDSIELPVTVIPKMVLSAVGVNPTTVGGTDGKIVLTGMPDDLYSVSYTDVSSQNLMLSAVGNSIEITNLSAGAYTNISISMAIGPGCASNVISSITLVDPNNAPATAKVCAHPSNGQVDLSWDAVTAATSGYQVIYGTDSTATTGSQLVPAGTTTATITGLTNNTLYYFAVVSVGGETSNFTGAVPVVESGKALSFNGVDQFINAGSDAGLPSNGDAVTLEAWVKASTFAPSNPIIQYGRFGGINRNTVQMQLTSTGQLEVSQNANSAGSIITSSQELTLNKWYHVAFVYPGGTAALTSSKFYINGKSVSFTNSGVPVVNTIEGGEILIGQSDNGTIKRYLTGEIDEVRIWDRALTQLEIDNQKDRLLTATEKANGLVGLWHFDEPSGNIVYDASCNGRHGTLQGIPAVVESRAMHPFQPDILIASKSCGEDSIQLAWSPNIALDVENYLVYRDVVDSIDTSIVSPISVSGTDTSFKDGMALIAGTTYYYQVAGIDFAGQIGSLSDVVAVVYSETDTSLTIVGDTTMCNPGVLETYAADSVFWYNILDYSAALSSDTVFMPIQAGKYRFIKHENGCADSSRVVEFTDMQPTYAFNDDDDTEWFVAGSNVTIQETGTVLQADFTGIPSNDYSNYFIWNFDCPLDLTDSTGVRFEMTTTSDFVLHVALIDEGGKATHGTLTQGNVKTIQSDPSGNTTTYEISFTGWFNDHYSGGFCSTTTPCPVDSTNITAISFLIDPNLVDNTGSFTLDNIEVGVYVKSCDPFFVTKTVDDGTCGTFSNAINFANANKNLDNVIVLDPLITSPIVIPKQIVITDGNLVIEGNGNTLQADPNFAWGGPSSNIDMIQVWADSFAISNAVFDGVDNINGPVGAIFDNEGNVHIDALIVKNFSIRGVQIVGDIVTIENSVFYKNGSGTSGTASDFELALYGKNILVSNNTFGIDEFGADVLNSSTIAIYIAGNASNVTIGGGSNEGNLIMNQTSRGIFVGAASNVVIAGNTITKNGVGINTSATDSKIGTFDFDSDSVNIIAFNTSHGIVMRGTNNKVIGNAIVENGGNGIEVTSTGINNNFSINGFFGNAKGINIAANAQNSVTPAAITGITNTIISGNGVLAGDTLVIYGASDDEGELILGIEIAVGNSWTYTLTKQNIDSLVINGLDSIRVLRHSSRNTSEFSNAVKYDNPCSLTFNSGIDDTLTVCSDDTLLQVTLQVNESVRWFLGDTLGTSLSSASSYTVLLPGWYFVVLDSGSCTAVDSFFVETIVGLENDFTYANLDLAAGAVDFMADNVFSGETFAWYSITDPIAISNDPNFSPAVVGTYYMLRTSGNCTVSSDTIEVVNSADPCFNFVVDLGADITTCDNSVSLDAGKPGLTYTWTALGNSTIATPTNQTITATNSDTYTVTVDSLNCTATDDIVVQLNGFTLSATSITNETTVGAADGAVDLDVTPAVAISSYSWQNLTTLANGGAVVEPITGLVAADYKIIASSVLGCKDSVEITVGVGTTSCTINKAIGVTPSTTSVCTGTNLTLTLATTENGVTYQVMNGTTTLGAALVGTGSSIDIVLPSTQIGGIGTHTLTIIAQQGTACTETLTTEPQVIIQSGVAPTIQPANVQLCAGTNTVLSVAGTSGATYQWFIDGNKLVGATSNAVTAFIEGEYTVNVGGSACGGVVTPVTVNYAISNAPDPVISSLSSDPLVLSTSVVGATYQWYVDYKGRRLAIVGATKQTYSPQYNGAYYVSVNAAGDYCTRVSDVFNVASKNTSIARVNLVTTANSIYIPVENVSYSSIDVLPNPAFDAFAIRYRSENIGLVSIEILNMNGVAILNETISKSGYEVELPIASLGDNVNAGVYIVRVLEGTNVSFTKLVIE